VRIFVSVWSLWKNAPADGLAVPVEPVPRLSRPALA